MLTASVIVSAIAAVVVQLRHRSFVAAVEVRPYDAVPRRARFLLETWALTTPGLLLLALAQPGLA
jgi:hypothetical protein